MPGTVKRSDFKEKALQWANSFNVCCFLDSNGYADPYGKYDWLVAAGTQHQLMPDGNAFDALKDFYDTHKNYLFGFLSYDLKNETEALQSANSDGLGFPELFFFVPQYLIAVKGNSRQVLIGDQAILQSIDTFQILESPKNAAVNIQPRINKPTYLDDVAELKQHIKRGDIYEVNFCQEFFASNAKINPLAVFKTLNAISPTPFSGYFKVNSHFILSATPERFLSKKGDKLVSQPIKGTAKRSKDPTTDEQIKTALQHDPKERAENVMIVDLVRHDLTKSALKGSVTTEELFGVYTFPQVHQLISTVSCTIDPGIHFIDAIKNCFPMGSMTGAPKIKAMELIEKYEHSKRGVYSGTFGWISPAGDFDFNVVIRTILYNAEKEYLSYHVGGAITHASDPELEYEECLVKASAILQALALSCT